jgi:hypothetical protein
MLHPGRTMTDPQPLNGMHVFLTIDDESHEDQIAVTVAISKPLDTPPITDDTVAVILEDEHGQLLQPVKWPRPGVFPEARMRSATASAEYAFARGDSRLSRAIVVLQGEFVEFPL